MTKPEWGTKRACASCGKRFYDLNKTPITCPQCGTVLELKKPTKPARSEVPKPVEAKKAAAVAPAAEEAAEWPAVEDGAEDEDEDLADVEEPAEGDDAEQEKDVIEDASDLGEDEDDVSEVKEHLNSSAEE